MLLVSLFVLSTVALALWVRRMHNRHAPGYAQEWRRLGRSWAMEGMAARSAWCHEWADYYDQPWWRAVWFSERPAVKPPVIDMQS